MELRFGSASMKKLKGQVIACFSWDVVTDADMAALTVMASLLGCTAQCGSTLTIERLGRIK
jgi:hypothetical protein